MFYALKYRKLVRFFKENLVMSLVYAEHFSDNIAFSSNVFRLNLFL